MSFFLLKTFLDFGPDFELVLDLLVGDFVDLGLVEIVPYELGGCKLFSDLNFLLNFGNLGVNFDEVLIIVASA